MPVSFQTLQDRLVARRCVLERRDLARRPSPDRCRPGRSPSRASRPRRSGSASGCRSVGSMLARLARLVGVLGCGPMSTHIGAEPGEIAPTVLLPGDPLRAQVDRGDVPRGRRRCYSEVRGMYGYTGTWHGQPVSVQGSGMGQPSMSIYVNELFKDYDVQRVIRVGSCGAVTERRGPARRGDRVGRLHRLLDEPAALPRPRLRGGGRLRPAAGRRRRGRGARRRDQPRGPDLLRRHVLHTARRS